eukprot:685702_1
MAQQQITVPDPKQELSQPQPQEINGSDHLNEKNDEEDNEFIERNIIAQMTTDEMDALCSGLCSTRLVHTLLILSIKQSPQKCRHYQFNFTFQNHHLLVKIKLQLLL